jgi:hypothetical protein
MEDNRRGLRNRSPFQTNQRVVTLSPILESYDGPQYENSPAFAGEVPADNLGFFPEGTAEVPDSEFRAWPEKRGKR